MPLLERSPNLVWCPMDNDNILLRTDEAQHLDDILSAFVSHVGSVHTVGLVFYLITIL